MTRPMKVVIQCAKPRKNDTSGYRGVSWENSTRKWVAYIRRNGRRQFLGFFDMPEAASAAYREAAKRLSTEGPDRRSVETHDGGSDRSALPAFELVGFSGPPSEPDVRLSPHPALHGIMPLMRSSPASSHLPMAWGCECADSGIG